MYRAAFVGFFHDEFFFLDITCRYLSLLALTTRDFAERSNRPEPVISDLRAAMEHVGLIHPVEVLTPPPPYRHSHRHHLPKRRKLETSPAAGNAFLGSATPTPSAHGLPDALELINNPASSLFLNHPMTMIDPTEILLSNNHSGMDPGAWGNERQAREGWEEEEGQDDYDEEGGEDTRGVDALIAWFKGPIAAEMRRVAGVTIGPGVEGGDSGNTTIPDPAVMAAIGNGSRTTPVVDMSGGIVLPAAGGEREMNPITWLDGITAPFLMPLDIYIVAPG